MYKTKQLNGFGIYKHFTQEPAFRQFNSGYIFIIITYF